MPSSSFITYQSFKYLKYAAVLIALTILLYSWHEPDFLPNGGTWLGYALGTIAFVLMLWLSWFGLRKRSYGGGRTTLQGWLSAHIYLGIALVIVASFHTGFQFGINLHTLAYVLLMLVVLTGLYGVYAYLYYPSLMTDNMGDQTLESLLAQIDKLEQDALKVANKIGAEAVKPIEELIRDTRIGGSVLQQLSTNKRAKKMSHDFESLIEDIKNKEKSQLVSTFMKTFIGADEVSKRDNNTYIQNLLDILSLKKQLTDRANRDIRHKAHLDIWLYFHVPLAFASLAAVIAHILSVFIYW